MKVVVVYLSFFLLTATMNAAEDKIVRKQPHNSQSKEMINPHKGLCYSGLGCCCAGSCAVIYGMEMMDAAKECLFCTNGGGFTGYHFEAWPLEKIAISAKSCAPHSLSQIPSSLFKIVSIIAYFNPCGGTVGTCSCCFGLGCVLCVASFCHASEKVGQKQQKNVTEHVVKQD